MLNYSRFTHVLPFVLLIAAAFMCACPTQIPSRSVPVTRCLKLLSWLVFMFLTLVLFEACVLSVTSTHAQEVGSGGKTKTPANSADRAQSGREYGDPVASHETNQEEAAELKFPEQIPGYREARYDEMAWLVTHNAMSNREEGWWFPNQSYGITRQLEDGVRGLMLDVHVIDDQPFLVHSSAILGKAPLADGLAEIREFMKKNPDVIVTIIFECYAPSGKMQRAFDKSGLLDLLHVQRFGDSWPTMKEMISKDRRLVVFTDSGGGKWAGYHDVWRFCQETHFSVKRVEDFDFKRNRGKGSNPLFILNHFLTRPTAGLGLAMRANASDVLKPRIEGCEKATMRFPNYVVVDFYECGNTPDLVMQFNVKRMAKSKVEQPNDSSTSAGTLEK